MFDRVDSKLSENKLYLKAKDLITEADGRVGNDITFQEGTDF